MISSMKKCAATIQEMFDCDVLHIPWSELKVGKPVGRENVFKASRYYKKRNKNDEFINWYLNKDYMLMKTYWHYYVMRKILAGIRHSAM
jgi:hypothetical protein